MMVREDFCLMGVFLSYGEKRIVSPLEEGGRRGAGGDRKAPARTAVRNPFLAGKNKVVQQESLRLVLCPAACMILHGVGAYRSPPRPFSVLPDEGGFA